MLHNIFVEHYGNSTDKDGKKIIICIATFICFRINVHVWFTLVRNLRAWKAWSDLDQGQYGTFFLTSFYLLFQSLLFLPIIMTLLVLDSIIWLPFALPWIFFIFLAFKLNRIKYGAANRFSGGIHIRCVKANYFCLWTS